MYLRRLIALLIILFSTAFAVMGQVNRPYLGIIGRLYTSDGYYVLAVDEGSPADEAGIAVGDIITKIGNYELTSPLSYDTAILQLKGVESTNIEILKDGNERDTVQARVAILNPARMAFPLQGNFSSGNVNLTIEKIYGLDFIDGNAPTNGKFLVMQVNVMSQSRNSLSLSDFALNIEDEIYTLVDYNLLSKTDIWLEEIISSWERSITRQVHLRLASSYQNKALLVFDVPEFQLLATNFIFPENTDPIPLVLVNVPKTAIYDFALEDDVDIESIEGEKEAQGLPITLDEPQPFQNCTSNPVPRSNTVERGRTTEVNKDFNATLSSSPRLANLIPVNLNANLNITSNETTTQSTTVTDEITVVPNTKIQYQSITYTQPILMFVSVRDQTPYEFTIEVTTNEIVVEESQVDCDSD